MNTKAALTALALLALLLTGCDGGAAATASGTSKTIEEPVGPDGQGGGKAADFAGDPDSEGDDPDVIETKVRVGGMVITRKRPRYIDKDKKIRVVKDPEDNGFGFPYRERGEKGEHLNRGGDVVKDKEGKPIKMH